MAESVSKADVTGLLRAWRDGGGPADDRLIHAMEGELRRIAGAYMRRERPDHTLQPTALVNEAYVRLVDGGVAWEGRALLWHRAARHAPDPGRPCAEAPGGETRRWTSR